MFFGLFRIQVSLARGTKASNCMQRQCVPPTGPVALIRGRKKDIVSRTFKSPPSPRARSLLAFAMTSISQGLHPPRMPHACSSGGCNAWADSESICVLAWETHRLSEGIGYIGRDGVPRVHLLQHEECRFLSPECSGVARSAF